MSKAMIVLEADRVDWERPTETQGGGLMQLVRLYEGAECRVVMQVHFAAGSAAALAWAEQKGDLQARSTYPVNVGSVASDVRPA